MPKKTTKPQINEDTKNSILRLAAFRVKDKETEIILKLEKGSIEKLSKSLPEFKDEMETAPVKLDIQVAEAMLKRALGYLTEEEHWVYTATETEESDKPVEKLKEIRRVKKFVPPDASTDLIWLYNRWGEQWSKNPNNSNNVSIEEYFREKEAAKNEARANM